MITPESRIILFKGKKLKDGSHPIVLQLKLDSNNYKRISLKMSAYSKEWNATDGRFKNSKKYERENRLLFEYQNRADQLIVDFVKIMIKTREKFNFESFKASFLNNQDAVIKKASSDKPNTLLGFVNWYTETLDEKNRLGTKIKFKGLHSVLVQCNTPKKLLLDDVGVDFLEELERKLIKRKNPSTGKPIKLVSVASYFKDLKTTFNKALYYEVTENYPFKNPLHPRGYSFSHLKSPRISKSMSEEEMERFLSFAWQQGTEKQKLSWLIAYFIYLFRGIPFADASRLRMEDIYNNEVKFGRVKTKNTVPSIPLTDKRLWIINELKEYTDGSHLIPILFDGRHDNPQQIHNRIAKMNSFVNQGMKEIGLIQGIDLKKISTYTLRHTFARKVLEKYGIWHLKEILGHKSVTTTQMYATSLSSKQLAMSDEIFE